MSSRWNDSSDNLAEALERAAEQHGGRTMELPKVKYTNCLCGTLVRCQLQPENPDTQRAGATLYGSTCPLCKRPALVTFLRPPTIVQTAQPGDVPPAAPH